MARHQASVAFVQELRLDGFAMRHSGWTARLKKAARGQIDQAWRHARNPDQTLLLLFETWYALEQELGIGMEWVVDHLLNGREINQFAGVHHAHAVGKLGN